MGDAWTVVGRKGRKRVLQSRDGQAHESVKASDADHRACVTLEQCQASVARLTHDLATSPFRASLQRAFAAAAAFCAASGDSARGIPCWSEVTRIRCYGLGQPSTNLNARAQLALVPFLLELLPGVQSVAFYDPMLSDLDKQLLGSLGHTTLSAADAREHAVDGPTLFYMPHCDACIYDEVLEANWRSDRLATLVILGNSFAGMQERWRGPTFKRRPGLPKRVLALTGSNAVAEEPLQGAGFHVHTAFNDTSLHVFPAGALSAADVGFLPSTPSAASDVKQRE